MILRFALGILLGLFFFGGLRFTVKRLLTSRHPLALSLGSLVVRMAVALTGFVLLMGGRWQYALTSLIGFMVARLVIQYAFNS